MCSGGRWASATQQPSKGVIRRCCGCLEGARAGRCVARAEHARLMDTQCSRLQDVSQPPSEYADVARAQVLEARVDHARVVAILRKADHLPLVKEYLLAVQKANLAPVNEAVNELLIEEEDFAGLRDSITTCAAPCRVSGFCLRVQVPLPLPCHVAPRCELVAAVRRSARAGLSGCQPLVPWLLLGVRRGGWGLSRSALAAYGCSAVM